eukprot:TRINITY_DN8623_c0_g1_i2.p1 TRINITY_DN8623_c0_g1~~TRINITY_DN8623_c0_g1_i2.p1  ORF type:complete len:182 (-),score=42.68 TRINITY_DN8623_c0_g1_i2:112-588(-)
MRRRASASFAALPRLLLALVLLLPSAASGAQATSESQQPGDSAPLTENGYWSVASLKDDDAMRSFVLRVMTAFGLRPKSDGDAELNGFVLWYSGSKATQNLATMIKELKSASWVERRRPAALLSVRRTPRLSVATAEEADLRASLGDALEVAAASFAD